MIFKSTDNSPAVSQVSSHPVAVHWCNEDTLTGPGVQHMFQVYPGQRFKIPIVLYGQRNGSVPGTVRAELEEVPTLLRYKKLKTLSIHVQT